jgi:hypothetical protein
MFFKKNVSFFVDATLAEGGLVTRLVTREFQFDDLCRLRQIAVS